MPSPGFTVSLLACNRLSRRRLPHCGASSPTARLFLLVLPFLCGGRLSASHPRTGTRTRLSLLKRRCCNFSWATGWLPACSARCFYPPWTFRTRRPSARPLDFLNLKASPRPRHAQLFSCRAPHCPLRRLGVPPRPRPFGGLPRMPWTQSSLPLCFPMGLSPARLFCQHPAQRLTPRTPSSKNHPCTAPLSERPCGLWTPWICPSACLAKCLYRRSGKQLWASRWRPLKMLDGMLLLCLAYAPPHVALPPSGPSGATVFPLSMLATGRTIMPKPTLPLLGPPQPLEQPARCQGPCPSGGAVGRQQQAGRQATTRAELQ